jgi:hypothetical protein
MLNEMELRVGTDPPQLIPAQGTFWGVGILVLKWDLVLHNFIFRAAIAGEPLHKVEYAPFRAEFPVEL